ncbi:uncharacterized protein Z518_08037 [Rhinocladiella mackenziei CBS 650.93]|uniref:Transcription factor domain-containing protein n=1 Tax=Rhinocladiella mackenziei CBS 650.93 TaxID=1442369 RepID=A0A0D2GV03_9EURO|nr:uncharacterized protein Z518_08037 [Rhinocladiella mackenziei CBS 650.93]KIX02098.1 hypothetical protein Z518_08037 [Rhinocladiella mackenziei CBS 650.93]
MYLDATAFSAQAYFDIVLGRRKNHFTLSRIGTESMPTMHFLKTVRLLRERLVLADEQAKVSDPTILVVLIFATHAHILGEHETAMHHMEGLKKMVDLRGGIVAFKKNSKLVIELLRCDIGIAFHSGSKPLFTFPDGAFADASFMPDLCPSPYPQPTTSTFSTKTPTTQNTLETLLATRIDRHISTVWRTMRTFCKQINIAAQTQSKLPQELFLHSMASVMYPILNLRFSSGSLDEALRLGLLAFSSNIFLQWQDARLPCMYFPTAYRSCLELDLEFSWDRHDKSSLSSASSSCVGQALDQVEYRFMYDQVVE